MTVSRLALASPPDESAGRLSDEVELYQRTYNTLLRSSGETALRVLESSHRAMGSSLHPLADSDEPDLGAAVNFSKLPIDFGIIHYASDTPYTQARTLGARGLSYYGMDSTYASSLAIARRVLRLEGVLD
jgi:hypothetical protein